MFSHVNLLLFSIHLGLNSVVEYQHVQSYFNHAVRVEQPPYNFFFRILLVQVDNVSDDHLGSHSSQNNHNHKGKKAVDLTPQVTQVVGFILLNQNAEHNVQVDEQS